LREDFLKLTESSDLTLLDVGRVLQRDFEVFRDWVAAQRTSLQPPSGGHEPLKILITHHPLVVQPATASSSGQRLPTGARRRDPGFQQLAEEAARAGFHLALHGHIHEARVLSDLSILKEPDAQLPMRQVGAGSLGDSNTFNEITATYAQDGGEAQWRLEIRTINLSAKDPHAASSFVLLNRTEDIARRAEELEQDKVRHSEFDDRRRGVVEQYTDTIYVARVKGARGAPELPQTPLLSIQDVVDDFVLDGFEVRVRLLVKDERLPGLFPRLTPNYLLGGESEEAGRDLYPFSLAALSLLLGRSIAYPRKADMPLGPEDYRWLRQSQKDGRLLKNLEDLARNPPPTGDVVGKGSDHYSSLRANLAAALAEQPKQPVTEKDFYRKARSASPTYPAFICLPYPRRRWTGGVAQVPEIAVLNVSVRAPHGKSDDALSTGVTPEQLAEQAFTPDNISMLESLADLVGTMLVDCAAMQMVTPIWQ
jgi:hypothetical protein